MNEIKPAYAGEAMLLRWGDTHSSGRTITIQLDENVGEQHPFKGLKCGPNGQRMQICAVLVDENEQPQNPHKTEPDSPPPVGPSDSAGEGQETRRTFRDMPASQQAALKCTDIAFQSWLEGLPHSQERRLFLDDEDYTRAILLDVLGITSRKELDTMPHKGELWARILTDFDVRGYK